MSGLGSSRLLASGGNLSLSRDPESGRVDGATAGLVTDSYSYSGYGELTTHTASLSGPTLLSWSYNRDDLGRITRVTESNGTTVYARDFAYDPAGRLISVTEDGELVEAYSYDANGNRLSTLNSAGVFQATYDAQDRIQSFGDVEYTFTPNGDLALRRDTTNNAVTTYDYDALGNLRTVGLPNGDVLEYLVDAQSRRIGKARNGVLEQGWLWRGQLQPIAQLDGSGNVVARFVYAGQSNVPELVVTASATYRLVKDHLGSVRMVVDTATGELVQELQYDAWGRVLVDTNPGFQPFGYAGGIYDAETGLVRFGARDYDAEIGRWTAKDPVRFEGGSNFYEYAASNPVDLTDPTGLDVGGLSPMQRERLERGLPPDGGDDGASSESADPSNSGPTVWDIPGVFPHPIFGFPVFIPGWMILGGLEGCDGDFSVRSAPTVIPGCEPNSTDRIAGCKEQIDSCNERTQHKKEKCCEDEGDKCKQCLTSANTAASGPCG